MGSMVARVAVDVPLAHLDRPFDYEVPPNLAETAVVGARVRVRFAGRQRDGYILDLVADSDRQGLSPLGAVVSTEPVLMPEVAALVRAVADHYAGSFMDVARLAVPPRHGITEKATPPEYPEPDLVGGGSPLADFPNGAGFLEALSGGGQPRAAWTLPPRPDGVGDWAGGMLAAARATLAGGRGVILAVPDQRDLELLASRATDTFGRGSFVTLTADVGPAARYRAFLAARRGQVRLVLGTRAAVFAPVHDLGLVALWDDGDDSWADPRAPYPHAREVAVLRSHLTGCGLLLAARSRTAEVHRLVESGWLHPIALSPAAARAAAPAIRACADDDRLPWQAFKAIREGLAAGPVLVSVPRTGYQPLVLCERCREVATCARCAQLLVRTREGLACRWCGPPTAGWVCGNCGGRRYRTPVAGVQRTAEEFGKAFPGTRVLQSSGETRLAEVGERPAIVLSTPGVEPPARFGYAAAVLLDTASTLRRPELRAGEEALRRWLSVAALVRPGADGGTVLLVGELGAMEVQAMLRLDPVGYAARQLADRAEAGFPPAVKLVTIEGESAVVRAALGLLQLSDSMSARGPFELAGPVGEDLSRATLRGPLSEGGELVATVRAMLAHRSARKLEGALRVRVDPQVVG